MKKPARELKRLGPREFRRSVSITERLKECQGLVSSWYYGGDPARLDDLEAKLVALLVDVRALQAEAERKGSR